MAGTFRTGPTYAAALETAGNLVKQKKPSDLRKVGGGTDTVLTAEQEAAKRAKEAQDSVEGTNLAAAPSVNYNTGAYSDNARKSMYNKGEAEFKGTVGAGSTDKAIDNTTTINQERAATQNKEALALIANNKSEKEKYLETTMNSSTAKGDVGQQSDYQKQDIGLAEVMADPSFSTTDIGRVAALMPTIDPMLQALASQVYNAEINAMRGESSQKLQAIEAAKGMKGRQVEGLLESGQTASERIGEQAAEATTSIDETYKEAVNKINENAAIAKEQVVAGRNAAAEAKRIENERVEAIRVAKEETDSSKGLQDRAVYLAFGGEKQMIDGISRVADIAKTYGSKNNGSSNRGYGSNNISGNDGRHIAAVFDNLLAMKKFINPDNPTYSKWIEDQFSAFINPIKGFNVISTTHSIINEVKSADEMLNIWKNGG